MTKTKPKPRILHLKVIDGLPAFPVRMSKRGMGLLCPEDKHCAAHGSGPYACCKCGSEFRLFDDDEKPEKFKRRKEVT